ncbi:hypothetical protein PtA15_9A209 [Puccinia triticina]|uniref:Uncharacterized protein n=1 Tax=Puccinia triticina TaxID=208348 RepID=A0ABY7CS95_9BASI|nr:uncharacterized protein PtA15_9A209 [Puccinia triticina]WAQ88084.1 hypothetical protein PtA15_9A209 [Puccinia triticina]
MAQFSSAVLHSNLNQVNEDLMSQVLEGYENHNGNPLSYHHGSASNSLQPVLQAPIHNAISNSNGDSSDREEDLMSQLLEVYTNRNEGNAQHLPHDAAFNSPVQPVLRSMQYHRQVHYNNRHTTTKKNAATGQAAQPAEGQNGIPVMEQSGFLMNSPKEQLELESYLRTSMVSQYLLQLTNKFRVEIEKHFGDHKLGVNISPRLLSPSTFDGSAAAILEEHEALILNAFTEQKCEPPSSKKQIMIGLPVSLESEPVDHQGPQRRFTVKITRTNLEIKPIGNAHKAFSEWLAEVILQPRGEYYPLVGTFEKSPSNQITSEFNFDLIQKEIISYIALQESSCLVFRLALTLIGSWYKNHNRDKDYLTSYFQTDKQYWKIMIDYLSKALTPTANLER